MKIFVLLFCCIVFINCDKDCGFDKEIDPLLHENMNKDYYSYATKNEKEHWVAPISFIEEINYPDKWMQLTFTTFDPFTQTFERNKILIFFDRSNYVENQIIKLSSLDGGLIKNAVFPSAKFLKLDGDALLSFYDLKKNCDKSYLIINKITDSYVEGTFQLVFEVDESLLFDEETIVKFSQGFFKAEIK
jgi:hypothetical protein